MGRNIVLVGLMGAGKTSAGKLLSQKLSLSFADTDELIAEEEKLSIPEIFSQKGESAFRKTEQKVILKISKCSDKIISTGGGSFENEDNIKNLKQNGIIFYLKASPKVLFERVKNDDTRPLLKTEDPLKTLENLLKTREKNYMKADYIVDTDKINLADAVEFISKVYYENC